MSKNTLFLTDGNTKVYEPQLILDNEDLLKITQIDEKSPFEDLNHSEKMLLWRNRFGIAKMTSLIPKLFTKKIVPMFPHIKVFNSNDKNNNVLFEIRAKEPRKGFAALPGGFIDADETAEDAAKRECCEEIGADVQNIKYVCSFPNTYEYRGIVYKTCDMFFTAELAGQYDDMETLIKSLKAEESEVTSLVYYKIDSEEDVDLIPIAFDSSKKTLKKWVRERK